MSELPWLVVPYRREGCLEKVAAFVKLWAWRLVWAAVWFGLGYGCGCKG